MAWKPDPEKPCTACGQPRGHDKRYGQCRPCAAAYAAAWRARNPNKAKAYARKSYYGLEDSEFQAMFVRQSGCCLICEKRLTEPHVDHDHVTGEVRGLLCQKCNVGIGMMGDNAQNLIRAAQYLEVA